MCSRVRYWQVKGSLSDEAACLNRPKFSFNIWFLVTFFWEMADLNPGPQYFQNLQPWALFTHDHELIIGGQEYSSIQCRTTMTSCSTHRNHACSHRYTGVICHQSYLGFGLNISTESIYQSQVVWGLTDVCAGQLCGQDKMLAHNVSTNHSYVVRVYHRLRAIEAFQKCII